MDVKGLKRIYFIGIGGIGMSALARFFRERGAVVKGYDKTETELTRQLESEGIEVHYIEDLGMIDANAELVIYTPAIPADNKELKWYLDSDYPVFKRSEVLEWVTASMHAITVAGTHGKTTVSTMIAYMLRETGYGCNAFLGGISVNYNSNYWSSEKDVVVVEADEYDRSFLRLHPDIAVLTAMDPDHLDVYGTVEEMEEAFIQHTKKIKRGGTLVVKQGLNRMNDLVAPTKITYSIQTENADVAAKNIVNNGGGYVFDVDGKTWNMEGLKLSIGGIHNVENAVAAITITQILGIEKDKVKTALAGFKGVRRRFEYIFKSDRMVYIDDYAHHPEELSALIQSAKHMFANRKCVIAFQPHLYTRTRDLAEGFARSLDMADKILLLDIYPARELPIQGVSTSLISDKMKNPNHMLLSKKDLLEYVENNPLELFITAGAGNIDQLVEPIKKILLKKYE
jgi:UDP-N-acetylmuramate--alanine ligase